MNKGNKRTYRIYLGLVALMLTVVFCGTSYAGPKTGNISTWIKRQLSLTEDRGMDFATINADASGDTVTLTPASTVSSTGASAFSGTPLSGQFEVKGQKDAFVTVSFSSGDTLTGPGTAMALGNFVPDTGFLFQMPNNGKQDVFVGADLTINASQAAGAYAGTYTFTVDYQ